MVETCDVVLVGGGIAGVSVAAELATDRRVVVLEAEREVPFHTTGRSAAMHLPSYGGPAVRELARRSSPIFAELEQELEAPPLLRRRDLLYVATHGQEAALRGLLDGGVDEVSVRQACAEFPALRSAAVVGAAANREGHDVDVLALHEAYLRGVRARGGRLVRGAPVVAMERRGSSWLVETPAGSWSCADVVNAAGAWADEVAELAGQPRLGVRPLLRSAFVAPVEAPTGFLSWPFLLDVEERWYAKPEGDALLCSPAEETPTVPCDARPDELEIARALETVREVVSFPLLSVRAAWAGLRSFVADREPVVGESEPGSGFWWCAGQGGYGIQVAPALARLTAAALRGSGDPLTEPLSPLRGLAPADLR